MLRILCGNWYVCCPIFLRILASAVSASLGLLPTQSQRRIDRNLQFNLRA